MILAVDVYYQGNDAFCAGILFNDWSDCEPIEKLWVQISGVASYVAGEFYRRELPPILALLEQLNDLPNYIVIDGYVLLGENKTPGLGKHLHDVLQGHVPIIGVAKTRFKDTPLDFEIYRGRSKRPLYVTSAGITNRQAKQYILMMCGESRIPVLLRAVDKFCRQMAAEVVG